MFNNSTVLPLVSAEKEIWNDPVQCVLWHVQNKTTTLEQAEAACSMDNMDVTGLEIAPVVILLGIFTFFTNALVIWGILVTHELHKPLYFYMSNLALADIFGGIGLMIQAAKLATIRGVMTTVTFMTHSQVMSASALALMSVNCYIAVRHPIYLHTHAHTAKRNAALAIVSSWLVLSLFTFSPAMGWNCLDMPVADCFDFFHTSYMGILVAVALLCIVVMLFTNTVLVIWMIQRCGVVLVFFSLSV